MSRWAVGHTLSTFRGVALGLLSACAACASSASTPLEAPRPPSSATAAPDPGSEKTPAPTCPVGSPAAALPEAPSAALVEKLGSSLDTYDRTAGLWLGDQPLLVNEPFDFAIAMSMPDIGPALAAGKRKQANEAKLALLADVELDASLHERLSALRGCGLHAYALLWGPSEGASLRVVVDVFVATPNRLMLARSASLEVGDLPLEGTIRRSAEALSDSFAGGLETALRSLDDGAGVPSPGPREPEPPKIE